MHSFLSSLLTMSLGGSVLVLAALVLRFVFKKLKAPAWLSILLWAAVAIRLLIPSLPKSTVSVMPQPEAVSEVVEAMVPAAVQAPAPAQENDPTVSFPADDPRTPTFPEGATGVTEPEEEKRFTPSAEFFFAVWGVGAAAVLGWGVLGWLRLEQRVRVSVKGERNVYFCDDIQSPFLLGLFAPRIYVPSFLEGEALNNVLAHEQAHLKRRDYLIKPFAFLLLAVYWFNPLFWLAYALLCRDIEYACDEKVFKNMDREAIASYSETLLTFHAPGRMLSACPVAFGEVGVKRRIKAALSYKKPAFRIILAAALVLGCVCVFLLTDRTADVTRIFPAESEEIRTAVHEAALREVQGKGWAEGAAEGHVMLGSEEKDGVTEVYAYCGATELGFINGVLTSDGTGFSGPCTFLLQPQDNGGYVCVDIIWPKDCELYEASINKMMPPSLWRKAQRNETAIVNAIKAQKTEDAKAYLQSLGREAEIKLDRWELNRKHLTDLGVHLLAAERSEKERPTALEQCPSFVGTTEILENDVLRWVYETALDADNNTIVYSKSDYYSGSVFARAVCDAQTGELIDQLVYENLSTAYPQYTDVGVQNGSDLVYGSKIDCDLNGNGVPDTLYLIYQQGFRLLAVENGAPLAESDFVTNGDEYELVYDENEADPVRLTAHYFSDTGIIRLNAPVLLRNSRIETEPAADGFPRYVDPMTYNTTSPTTQFIPDASTLSETESIRIYDADDPRVLAGVLRHDPELEQDFGTLKTMYELTLDGKNVISYANSSETGMFDARLCDNGYYALGLEKTECSLIRFKNGKEPEILYRASRDPKQETSLIVLKNGNVAVVTVSQKHVLTCTVVSPAGKTVSTNKTELAWDGHITQLRMIPLTDGGVCYSAHVTYDPELNSTDETESTVTGIVSAAGELTAVDGAYGQCCGVCGEYLLFSAYENNQADGQVISLYKDGKVEAQIERKPPENNVLIGFMQYGPGLLAAACYGDGEVYLEAQNGELFVHSASPDAFAPFGGIVSVGGLGANSGMVFSESLGVYPYRTVLSITVKDLIESEYPDFEVLAVVSDTQATGPSQVRYAAITRNKEDQTSSTLFVLNDYGVLAHVVLAAGSNGQYLEQYNLHLEQDRVSFSLSLNGDGGEREIHDFTVTCSLKDGRNIEFKNVENKHAS